LEWVTVVEAPVHGELAAAVMVGPVSITLLMETPQGGWEAYKSAAAAAAEFRTKFVVRPPHGDLQVAAAVILGPISINLLTQSLHGRDGWAAYRSSSSSSSGSSTNCEGLVKVSDVCHAMECLAAAEQCKQLLLLE
jgi:hypothetical protein